MTKASTIRGRSHLKELRSSYDLQPELSQNNLFHQRMSPDERRCQAKFWDYLEKTFVSDFTFSNIRHQLLPAATEMHAHGAKVDFSCHIGSEILKYTSALYFAINKSKNLWNHKSCLYLFPFNNTVTECTLQILNRCFLLFFSLGSLSKWFSAVRVACNTWISKSMP